MGTSCSTLVLTWYIFPLCQKIKKFERPRKWPSGFSRVKRKFFYVSLILLIHFFPSFFFFSSFFFLCVLSPTICFFKTSSSTKKKKFSFNVEIRFLCFLSISEHVFFFFFFLFFLKRKQNKKKSQLSLVGFRQVHYWACVYTI